MARSTRLMDLLEMTAKLHLASQAMARSEAQAELAAQAESGQEAQPSVAPVVAAAPAPVTASVTAPVVGGVVCACCAESFVSLKRHLQVAHGMDEQTYRNRYNIALEEPLVAASYLAKKQACLDAYRGGKSLSL